MIQRPFAHLLSALRLCLVLAVVAVVASCGGGGTSGGKDLHVSFDYPASYLRLWEPANVAPSLGGLHGNAPHCSLVSGSLAPGLALGGDCLVRGTPMQVGAFGGTVRLTVSGYDGYVDAWYDGTVPAPSLFAAQAHLTVDGASWSVLWGVPESAQMFNLVNFNEQDGDSVVYKVTRGALPAGLNLDPATARLQGVPAALGSSTAYVVATVQRNGLSYTTAEQALAIEVNPLGISYKPCCDLLWASAFSLAPDSLLLGVQGGTKHYSASALPSGISVDASTGVISGMATTEADLPIKIDWTFTQSNGASTSGTYAQTYKVFAPRPNYFYTQLTVDPGQPFTLAPRSITFGLPGDTYAFSLLPDTGSYGVPSWVTIDPATGVISGSPPANTRPSDASAYLLVAMTTNRYGNVITTQVRQTFFVRIW